jgi:hypothetical protein
MEYYTQTKNRIWLSTEAGTIWVSDGPTLIGHYVQPEDENLRETPLGVDLDLLDEIDFDLFKPLITIQIS